MENIKSTKQELIPKKYSIDEFWDSLYFECNDSDDKYDGFFHVISTIDGSEKKVLIKDIINAGARSQNNSN